MVKIDVCVEPLFPGLPFNKKILNLSACGYKAVEFWFWDHYFDGQALIPEKKDIKQLSGIMKDQNMVLVNIVVNSPDGAIGGFLNKPGDRHKYLDRLKETIEVAGQLGCSQLITCTGNQLPGMPVEKQVDDVIATLQPAAAIAEKAGMILLLEPLNTYVDHPGYLVGSSRTGLEIVKQVNNRSFRLLYDIYHMQVMEGNHISTIRDNIEWIGHFHSAGVPGRDELFKGELNYPNIISEIDKTNYSGYFGLEYFPAMDSEESLARTKEFLKI